MPGFKTVLYGMVLALISIFSSDEMRAFIAENLPWFGTAAGGIVVILRALTSTPIFKKES